MTHADERAKTLAEFRARLAVGRVDLHTLEDLFELARTADPAALPIILELIDDGCGLWRARGVAMLRRYDLWDRPEVVDRLRSLLLWDEALDVRAEAAVALGEHGAWPEPALQWCTRDGEERTLRLLALRSAMQLAGVPKERIRDVMDRVRVEEEEIASVAEELFEHPSGMTWETPKESVAPAIVLPPRRNR